MERRNPVIALRTATAEKILGPVVGRRVSVESLERLSGGLSNSNYLTRLCGGAEFVIRIWTCGEERMRAEIQALAHARGRLPVPRLLQHWYDAREVGFHVGVFEKVDGVPLWSILNALADEREAKQAGSVVGEGLAALRHPPPGMVSFSASEGLTYIRSCLESEEKTKTLGSERRRALHALLDRHENWLLDIAGPLRHVHGDFKGDNILVRKEGGRWKLAAALDWEWSHAGSSLTDVATLLRDDRSYGSPFTKSFAESYRRAGGWLPQGWKIATRIFDLVNHCERLANSKGQSVRLRRSVEYIDATLRECSAIRPRVAR